MSSGLLMLLRLVHIVVGVFWVGAVAFIAFFLLPTIQSVGAAGEAVMRQLNQIRRMQGWLTAAAVLTILAGLLLYWHDSAGFGSVQWMRSGPGVTFGLGAVLAIAATGFHSAVIAPAARELAAIMARADAAGGPPSSDLATVQRLQARLAWGARTWAVLLLLAAAAMSVARYVG
jgi:uncharacterized membrane protein